MRHFNRNQQNWFKFLRPGGLLIAMIQLHLKVNLESEARLGLPLWVSIKLYSCHTKLIWNIARARAYVKIYVCETWRLIIHARDARARRQPVALRVGPPFYNVFNRNEHGAPQVSSGRFRRWRHFARRNTWIWKKHFFTFVHVFDREACFLWHVHVKNTDPGQ
jgi:hypothetical protein